MFTTYYPTRFTTADHVTYASGANAETEAHLRTMYDLIFIRQSQYAVTGGTQFMNYYQNAADPYGQEKLLAYSWNSGINAGLGTVATMSSNYSTWVATPNVTLPKNQPF